MVENEFKLMLNEEQYCRIKSAFEWDDRVEQTNYYYDNASLDLSERHITCRVRRIGSEHFLQMKLPNGAAYSRIELESPLGNTLPEIITADMMQKLCGAENLPEVMLLGSLQTTRLCKHFEGAEIDLDKSVYFNQTDYELEIEFTDEQTARDLLEKVRAIAEISQSNEVCRGKIRRFLDEYLKTK
ncbi:MAG: CYTH domain-containing protein [Oscillospiraceae bacterium]